MSDRVVSEEEPVPVLGELALYHVDVVGACASARLPLDEPCVEGRTIVSVRGTPEVVVPLRLQEWRARISGRLQVGNLHQDVHDRLRGEPRDRRAAEVLNAPEEVDREA